LLPASHWFLAWLVLRPWRLWLHVPPNRRLTFNGLHGILSQKIELFNFFFIFNLYFWMICSVSKFD
jgi:hypothetical protein